MSNKIFQVAILQSLVLGYFKKVIDVEELLTHGNIGLGTFENIDGEMIVLDGHCYRAHNDGSVAEADKAAGVPFAAVASLHGDTKFTIDRVNNIDALKLILNNKIDEAFGLNSIHVAKIDAHFSAVYLRSESSYASQHVELKEVLSDVQKEFSFQDVDGTIVALYYPDYMSGINAAGWHFHFISRDRTKGGHIFELSFENAKAFIDKISTLEIKLPAEPAFDTYELKGASEKDVKAVEQGKQ